MSDDDDNVVVTLRPDEMPDWMPMSSAFTLPEGTERYGSTGQLWRVVNGQWVRQRGRE